MKTKTMFPEAETELSKACDDLVEAENILIQSDNHHRKCVQVVANMLNKLPKKSVKHGGRVFSLRVNREKISVTSRKDI